MEVERQGKCKREKECRKEGEKGGLSQQEERKWPREMDKVIDQPGGDEKTS